jgi:succinate dehydrogenase/fumarate reductase iron-sulfur protein
MSKDISIVKIRRFNPEVDTEPYYTTYEVPHEENATVLDCLIYIYENLDPGVSYRYACKIGFCVSCLMVINGKPGFTCLKIAEKEMTIEPQIKKAILIKDLATDFADD